MTESRAARALEGLPHAGERDVADLGRVGRAAGDRDPEAVAPPLHDVVRGDGAIGGNGHRGHLTAAPQHCHLDGADPDGGAGVVGDGPPHVEDPDVAPGRLLLPAEAVDRAGRAGADRASAFPIHKAKGIAEEFIRKSGLPYTIIRSTIVFGAEDRFTNNIATTLRSVPFFFPVPGDGRVLLQPLWVEDLVTALLWSLQNQDTLNETYEIGGGEFFTFRQIVEILMSVTNARRAFLSLSVPTMRALFVSLDPLIPNANISTYWLDYIAVNRTCPVENLPRAFGLMPARFAYRLDYLARKPFLQRVQEALRISR